MLGLSIRTAKMAELLGVTTQTVRKYAKNGDIPHHLSPSGQLLFTDEDVAKVLGDNSDKDKAWHTTHAHPVGIKTLLMSSSVS